jgi:8-oxo-dGTP diphosphatase
VSSDVEILNLLCQISPVDDTEAQQIDFAKNWIGSGKELYRKIEPDIPSPHLVTYCALIDFDRKKISLGMHKLSGLWLPPGGHCHSDELPLETARRELMEEFRIEANFYSEQPFFLSITKTMGITDNRHIDVAFWYVSRYDSTREFAFDKTEFESVKSYFWDEVSSLATDCHIERFLNKLRRETLAKQIPK